MKTIQPWFREVVSNVSPEIKEEIRLTMGVSDKLDVLMHEKGISKVELARALDKRPSEITRWLSGQHNFTLRTIAILSTFFGKSLIEVSE